MHSRHLLLGAFTATLLVACDADSSKDDGTTALDPEGVNPGDCTDGVDKARPSAGGPR